MKFLLSRLLQLLPSAQLSSLIWSFCYPVSCSCCHQHNSHLSYEVSVIPSLAAVTISTTLISHMKFLLSRLLQLLPSAQLSSLISSFCYTVCSSCYHQHNSHLSYPVSVIPSVAAVTNSNNSHLSYPVSVIASVAAVTISTTLISHMKFLLSRL